MKSTRDSHSSSSKSTSAPLSYISSNFDNLEKAKAVLAEKIINIDQFYPTIESEIKLYTDKLSFLADNSEDIKETDLEFNDENLKSDSAELGLEIERNISNLERRESFIPNTLYSTKTSYRVLPTMKQILDTSSSEHYAEGMIALKSCDYTKSLVHFNNCVNLKPMEPSFYANRAEVYAQLSDFQSALVNYKHACILDPDNRELFERLAFFYVFHSQILCDQGSYSVALESICKAIEIFPDNQTFQIRAIVVLAALNRHSECLALIDSQINQNNQNPDYFVLRAKLHANFRNFSLCYYDLIDAIKLNPQHEEAHSVLQKMSQQAATLNNQAVEMALSNRLHESINKITLAIDLNPIEGEFHVKRGAFHRRMKDFTSAIDDFLMAMDKIDHNEQSEVYKQAQKQLVLTYNDFAVQCFNKKYLDEALTLLNKAIKADKSEPGFYMNRGDCFFQLQQWDFAKADYEQCIQLSTDYKFIGVNRLAKVAFVIGKDFFNKEQYEKSEEYFTEAINHNPQIPLFWNMRSRTRLLLEKYRDARIDLISNLCMTHLDKDSETLLQRLFPNKSLSQIFLSKLGKRAKYLLSQQLQKHLTSMGVDISDFHMSNKVNASSEIKSGQQKDEQSIDKQTSELASIEKSRSIQWEMRQLQHENSQLIKKSDVCLRRSSMLDVEIPSNLASCVSGIISKSDGNKYLVNDKGVMIKVIKPTGWRKFNSLLKTN